MKNYSIKITHLKPDVNGDQLVFVYKIMKSTIAEAIQNAKKTKRDTFGDDHCYIEVIEFEKSEKGDEFLEIMRNMTK